VRIAKKLAVLDLYWWEEPTTIERIELTNEIALQSPIPVATGEQFDKVGHFETLARGGHVSIYQPEPMSLGGITNKPTLDISIASSLTFVAGTVYELIDNTSGSAIASTFSGVSEGSTVTFSGYSFYASYLGGDGNDFTLTAVPEPGTWLLIGSGLLIAVLLRRYMPNRLS